MDILLTMNTPYYPFHGGGAVKANRYLLEALQRRGHAVRAIVPALMRTSKLGVPELVEELRGHGIAVSQEPRALLFRVGGVSVEAVLDPADLRRYFIESVERSAPDRTLVSSEDAIQNLLDAAVRTAPQKVVYLAHTAAFLPFGPQAFFPSPSKTQLFRRVGAIAAVSAWLAAYVGQWSELRAHAVPLNFFGEGPFPDLARFDRGFVTMVNPCAGKGISLFLALARRMPDLQFAAVPGWGTTEEDLRSLRALANVTILEPANDIARILEQSRVVLVPSLWEESMGRMPYEAQLHGVPVLASRVGGMAETMVDLLPVSPIREFLRDLNERTLPVAVIPDQDIGPWEAALRALLASEEEYARRSRACRARTLEAVARLSVEPFEQLLERVGTPAAAPCQDAPASSPAAVSAPPSADSLTPSQRALLVQRILARRGG